MSQVKKALLFTMILFLSSYGVAQDKAASSSQSNVFQEQLTNVKSIVRQNLSAISKPSPDNPFDKDSELDKHSGYEMKYTKDTFLQMDGKVKAFVQENLEKGMSLDDLVAATQDSVGWSQWPISFSDWDRRESGGVCDAAITDEEWLAPNNEVVVLYQSRLTPTGYHTYMFQNSFRAKEKTFLRTLGSFYGCLVFDDGETQCGDFYAEYYFKPGGSKYLSSIAYTRSLFGFLLTDPESIPSIMTALGPAGRVANFSINIYVWNPEYNLWEGTPLWGSDGVLHFEYDGETTELKYYQCLEPHADRPDTYACLKTVNLRQYYLENKEGIEKALQPVFYQGKRNSHILRPPHEVYEKRKQENHGDSSGR